METLFYIMHLLVAKNEKTGQVFGIKLKKEIDVDAILAVFNLRKEKIKWLDRESLEAQYIQSFSWLKIP